MSQTRSIENVIMLMGLKGGSVMERENLEKQAAEVWVQYGEALCKTFGFEGNMLAAPLLQARQADNTGLLKFIEYVRSKISELK